MNGRAVRFPLPAICKFYSEFYKTLSKKQPTFTRGMKKFLVTIIAVFYLGASVGATVNLHYCMGRLVNWDFTHKKDRTCNKCGMEKSAQKGCCEDKYRVLQVEKDQKAESAYQLMQPAAVAATAIFPSISSELVLHISEEHPVSNAPPRSQVPVHIRNCVFRI